MSNLVAVQENYSESIRPAMYSYRAAGVNLINFIENSAFFQTVSDHIWQLIGETCVSNKCYIWNNIVFLGNDIVGILAKYIGKLTSVFFPDAHLAVAHFDAGFKL